MSVNGIEKISLFFARVQIAVRLQSDYDDDRVLSLVLSTAFITAHIVISSVDVVLQDLFTKFSVVSLRETILGGNQWLSENTKLEWSVQNDSSEDPGPPQPTASPDDRHKPLDLKHIVLTPMQIRTFVAEITPNPARWVTTKEIKKKKCRKF